MIENRINISQTFGGRLDPHQFHYERMEVINQIYGTNEWTKLKNVVSSAKTITKEFSEDDIYIGLENIISNTGEYYPTSDKESISSAAVFKKGDILFPKLRPYLNKVYRADFDGKCSTEFHIFQAKGIDPDYLTIILRSSLIVNQTKHLMTGNTLPRLQTSDIEDLIIPTPSMEVQQRIVDIYSKASEQKRAKEQEAQTLLDSIDSYLLGELGITLPETSQRQLAFKVNISEMLGNMFDCRTYNAKTMALKEMINHYTGHKLKLRELVLQSIAGDWGVDETEVPENKADEYTKCLVIRATEFDNKDNLNLDNSRVKFRMIRNDKLNKIDIRSNDIFIEKSGGSPDQPVGRVAILTSEIEQNNVLCYSNFIHKIRIDSSKVLPQYLFYYLRTLYNVKVTESMQSQTNGIRNLIMGSFLGQHIILPPLAKQNEIAETISTIRAKASALQAEASTQLATAKAQIEKIILG